jgi:large subunit ribosomal protein L17
MRHRKASLKLNRTSSHRDAMFRNMVTSLFKHQRIQTTDVKAKELRRWADNLITLAKRNDVHARRQALSILREKDIVHKLFAEASEKYGARAGGYTRIIKLGRRPGDASPISMVELIFTEDEKKKKTKKKKTAKTPVEKRKVEKKKDVKEGTRTEEVQSSEAVIEKSKADEDEKIGEEINKDETKIEQVAPDDEAASLEPDTASEDADEKGDVQTLEPVESEKSKSEPQKPEDDLEKTETKE